MNHQIGPAHSLRKPSPQAEKMQLQQAAENATSRAVERFAEQHVSGRLHVCPTLLSLYERGPVHEQVDWRKSGGVLEPGINEEPLPVRGDVVAVRADVLCRDGSRACLKQLANELARRMKAA